MRILAAALVLVALPASFSAWAETLRDAPSGLAITAPEGYVAMPSPPSSAEGPGRAVFDIRRPGETDTGCRVAVSPAPGNAVMSQEQLNLRVASPQYQQRVISQLSTAYNLLSLTPVLHHAIVGLAAIGDLRPRPDLPVRADEIRTLLVFLETTFQNVSVNCVGEKDGFQDRIPGFEAVLRGLEIPSI